MKPLFFILIGIELSASLHARELPWKRKDSSQETPWSGPRQSDVKDRREAFIRSLESPPPSPPEPVLLPPTGTREDQNDTKDLPWKRFESEARGGSFGRLLLWPVEGGRISSGYGLRESGFHEGIDLAAVRGTPVRAASSGVVVFNDRLESYGRTVIVSHGDGYTSLYAHLDKTFVRKGSRIKQGVIIGSVGNSGRADGFHLHFEVRRSGSPVNPLSFEYQKFPFYSARGSSND